ncbi:MAG: NAD-dependent epimerase/dehydratase family protein [Planctomycetes bacterium]|nr:NAD-dependent epimerase/dehydratase family protein [Planctomycetota bacterium]
MRALVTGATGFVGSAVARALLAAGAEVRALVRPESASPNLDGLPVEVARGDLTDPASLLRAAAGCDEVYHVAAHYFLWSRDSRDFYRVNVDGSRELVRAAAEAGARRIVYTSTVGTIGYPPDGRPGNEETPYELHQVKGHYKRSKYLAEKEILKLAAEGAPIVVVNPSAPMGPRDVKPTPTGKIVVDFARGKMPAYLDTGLNVVHVDDVAAGHLLAAAKGRVGERYILGHENLSLRQILEILSEIAGRPAPRIRMPYWVAYAASLGSHAAAFVTRGEPAIPLDAVRLAGKKMFFDPSKAIRELGFSPRPAREALEDAYRWFAEHGYL